MLATLCLSQHSIDHDGGQRKAYFHHATRAEALLLLERRKEAAAVFAIAIDQTPDNYIGHATTLRQFELICDHQGIGTQWLEPFRPPAACHFAGSLAALSHFGDGAQPKPAALDSVLAANRVGSGYGALAAGADILIAEALIARGAQLHVVLPCTPELFKALSVDPFGGNWSSRFDRCLAAADSVMLATTDTSLSCHRALDLASTLAMGRAMEEAERHCTRAIQVTASTGQETGALTRSYRSSWIGAGHESFHVALDPGPGAPPRVGAIAEQNRFMATMLFADIAGFGGLNDEQVVACLKAIFAPLNEIINTHRILPCHRASWGDGLFLVYEDVMHAAEIALRMQEAFADLPLEDHGLPASLSLRIGGHYAPASFHQDPVTGRPSVYGSQVSYAARIEPETLPGSVFVSEHFAAALRVFGRDRFVAYFTGEHTVRKKAPQIRLFNLVRKR
ncbi:MAG: adenylate/guanylate cyclase domain-containing protein [Pseudomonadota bacterium]